MNFKTIFNQFSTKAIIIILICCLFLFSLDKDTHSIADLFKPGNFFALLLYFFPSYLISYFFYYLFRKSNNKNATLWSLVLGIPSGVFIVVVLLSFWMGRM